MMFGFRVAIAAMFTASLWAGSWSAPEEATDAAGNALVMCRAKLSGDHLVVEVRATQGWHVYAMDNQRRAREALAGRMSLGVEQDTEVLVSGGLKVVGVPEVITEVYTRCTAHWGPPKVNCVANVQVVVEIFKITSQWNASYMLEFMGSR